MFGIWISRRKRHFLNGSYNQFSTLSLNFYNKHVCANIESKTIEFNYHYRYISLWMYQDYQTTNIICIEISFYHLSSLSILTYHIVIMIDVVLNWRWSTNFVTGSISVVFWLLLFLISSMNHRHILFRINLSKIRLDHLCICSDDCVLLRSFQSSVIYSIRFDQIIFYSLNLDFPISNIWFAASIDEKITQDIKSTAQPHSNYPKDRTRRHRKADETICWSRRLSAGQPNRSKLNLSLLIVTISIVKSAIVT